jgi:hypothetical protein
MSEPSAYFVPAGPGRYRPTSHTGGAWSETEQHISPLGGLVVHAMEGHVAASGPPGGDGLAIARLSLDILGVVAIEELEIAVRTVRPGRTIELVEALVTSAGRSVVLARAWRLAGTDTSSVAGGRPVPIAGPDALPCWPMASVWPGGYIASLDVRRGADARPGRATAWVSSPLALLEGVAVSPLASYVALVDTANGICVREPIDAWLFPNVDLTVHLHRQPVAGRVGLDTTVVFGADGHGLTETVLHDERGPVGRAAQVLTVRPRR